MVTKLLFLSPKSEGNLFKHAIMMKLKIVIEIENCDFIWKISWLSFHAQGKTSCKKRKMLREICVQVNGKKTETFFRFLVGTLSYLHTNIPYNMMECLCLYSDVIPYMMGWTCLHINIPYNILGCPCLNIKGIVHLNIIFCYMKFNKICNLDHPVY